MAGGFIYNGENFASYGLCVADGVKLPGGYSRPLQIKGLPASNQVWLNRGESKPVTIEFPCRIAGDTHEELMNNLDAIKTALGTPTTFAPLYYFYEDRYHSAIWDGQELELTPNGPVQSCLSVDTVIRFVAQQNMYYNTLRNGYYNISESPSSIYVPSTGVVDGNTYTPTKWTIINNHEEDDIEEFILANYTTGHMISFSGVIQPNYRLIINRSDMTAILGTGSNYEEYENVADQIDGDEDWCSLLGGVQNRIDISGVSIGYIEYEYRGRYS